MRRLAGIFLIALLVPACGVGGGGTLTPTVQPAIPSGVTAAAGNKSVTVSWSGASSGATYVVKRSLTSGGPYFPVSVPGQFPTPTSYVDSGVANGTTYHYVVSATNQFGESADSAEAAVTPGFTPVTIVTGALSQFSMVVLPDRSVWSWGINDAAQLGSGTSFAEHGAPVQAVDLEGVVAGATGFNHALALRSDGTVSAWGANASGQLGLGAGGPVLATTAQPIPGFDSVVSLAAGSECSLALRSDGTVWAWGTNLNGLLGNGTFGNPFAVSPVAVPGLSNIAAISCGGTHNLALRNDGTVWMWGSNDWGQKGDGTVTPATPVASPAQVPNLTGIVFIAAGLRFNLAVRSDGTVWAWGSNQWGQQGNGATSLTPVATPAAVAALSEIVSVAAGRSHAFALKSNGTVWAWGQNQCGQIGNGVASGTPVTTPAPLAALTDIAAVGAGDFHSLALRNDGTLFSWGNNINGEVGNGTSDRVPVPVPVMNLTDVHALGSSWFHTLALRGDGTVWAWGENSFGALGNGSASATVFPTPAAVTGLTGATAVAAGLNHSLAIVGGTVRGWGSNASGQLGTGSSSGTPVTSPAQALVLTNITAVAGGANHSLALRNNGTVWAWGSNSAGQLGTGGGSTSTPVQIPSLAGITAIATGNGHSLALRNDGTVWAWGPNSFGEIGIGTQTPSVPTPTQVLNLPMITAISGGFDYSLALASDGTVWGWGANQQGQVGIGPAGPPVLAPVQVAGLTGVTRIDAGGAHSLTLRSDGTVWAWGWNDAGQLGSGSDTVSIVPLPASTPAGVTAISAGAVHSLAVLADKTLMAWGFNGQSQLARPFVIQVPTPAVISP